MLIKFGSKAKIMRVGPGVSLSESGEYNVEDLMYLLVHDVFGGVDEWIVGSSIPFDGLPSRDVLHMLATMKMPLSSTYLELTSGNSILNPLIS